MEGFTFVSGGGYGTSMNPRLLALAHKNVFIGSTSQVIPLR